MSKTSQTRNIRKDAQTAIETGVRLKNYNNLRKINPLIIIY
jgi:hypothetical protein